MTQIRNVGADAAAAAEPIAAVTAQLPPLTARSVLASALLGMDPPELPVSQLVRLTGLFGISENRARVALSRMVAPVRLALWRDWRAARWPASR